jgi:hypothetical protein
MIETIDKINHLKKLKYEHMCQYIPSQNVSMIYITEIEYPLKNIDLFAYCIFVRL